MRKHHYRVVSPLRFFLFVLLVVFALTFAVSTVISSGTAKADSYNSYLQVTVHENESLWNIAENYCSEHRDLRDYVLELREINDLEADCTLQEGDVIFVPLNS